MEANIPNATLNSSNQGIYLGDGLKVVANLSDSINVPHWSDC